MLQKFFLVLISIGAMTAAAQQPSQPQVKVNVLNVCSPSAEEKEAIAQYGSSDSGATLGDILGTALKRATEKPAEKKE